MKVVNKETLAKMPVGTVFTTYEPHCIDGELHIKTGDSYCDRPSWNGEILMHPDFYDICEYDDSLNKDIHSNMWSTDIMDIDYDDDQLFMVFSKAEIINIASTLLWAANDCNGNCITNDISFLGEDIYWRGN